MYAPVFESPCNNSNNNEKRTEQKIAIKIANVEGTKTSTHSLPISTFSHSLPITAMLYINVPFVWFGEHIYIYIFSSRATIQQAAKRNAIRFAINHFTGVPVPQTNIYWFPLNAGQKQFFFLLAFLHFIWFAAIYG